MWPAWRLVIENVATLAELKTSYSYDDMVRANAVLDLKIHMEEKATERTNKKAQK